MDHQIINNGEEEQQQQIKNEHDINSMNDTQDINTTTQSTESSIKHQNNANNSFQHVFGATTSIPLSPIPQSTIFSLPVFDKNRYKDKTEENDDNNNNTEETTHKSRYTPYRTTPHLDYQERLELVEQVTSMFPLLEKDGKVYSILERNEWSVEKSFTELQKRHDYHEALKNKDKSNNIPNFNEVEASAAGIQDTMKDDPSLEMSEGRSISLSDSMSYDEELELDCGEEFVTPDDTKYPKLNEDIKTLQDIFGTTYQEYELKGFYIMCNGNMELVIDQLVTEQNQINKVKEEKPTQPPPPREPLTSRLSEADKRALQMQLIEEQEKLEKNFEFKKKEKESAHPNKKTYSQQEILKELKELFGKTVEEGVIEWVAYSCEYNLGNCVTQLIDLKNNSLMKKGAVPPLVAPQLDPTVQFKLQNGFAELLHGMVGGGVQKAEAQMTDETTPTNLTSQGSFDSFITDVQSKLTAGTEPTTTTTTTSTTKAPSPSLWSNNIKLEKGEN